MYKHSQQNTASFEARISQYSIQSVEEDKKIIAAREKLHDVTNESKKIVLEEQMNRQKLADAQERLSEEKAYLK